MDNQEPDSEFSIITAEHTNSRLNGHANKRHEFRRILAQVLVAGAQSLLVLDMGMKVAVPTIVISNIHNAKEGLSLNDDQSSWFVSIMFLVQPIGSVLSGCIIGTLGRKKAMLLVNLPNLVVWYLLYSAETVATLYAASLIMGFSIGLQEAPILAHIGEISEPHLRGTLFTICGSSVVVGHLLEFVLSWMLPSWRQVMLVSCTVPVVTALVMSQIPESPIWLLTKGKKSEALSALKWLRGWVSDDEVIDEFHSLELYCETSKNEYQVQLETRIRKKSVEYKSVSDGENVTSVSNPGFIDNCRDLLRPEILRPLRLIIAYICFYHAASLTAMRPYMIEILIHLEVSISPNLITVVSALTQFAGSLVCICLVRLVGKRVLSLVSMTSCSLCSLLLGIYTYAMHWYKEPALPLFLFCALFFSISVGINSVPWMLISEVFPTRGREVACGVCTAVFYITAFLVSKTWLNILGLVGLHGCFLMYGMIGALGIVYVYVCLPETEGKTLAEIEKFFTKKTKALQSPSIIENDEDEDVRCGTRRSFSVGGEGATRPQ